MNLRKITLYFGLSCSVMTFAQEVTKKDTLATLMNAVDQLVATSNSDHKLTIGGYVQTQFETTGKDGSTKVGLARNATETADLNRFGVRRTRLKVGYKSGFYSMQVELDMNATEFTMRDSYIKLTDPYKEMLSLNVGIFNRPFGYEIGYSTVGIESAERSRVITTLMPDEKDQGAMLTLQGPKNTFWNNIKLEAGLFGGNGYRIDLDNKKDFIGHLSFSKSTSDVKYGFGVSAYDGYISQLTKKVYSMSNGGFAVDSTATNKGQFAKRAYLGFDGNLNVSSFLGMTSLRAEYILGQQPGTSDATKSPISNTLYAGDTYIRSVRGGYVHLVQDIGTTKHSITLKYDFYDPNTKIAGNQIGASVLGTSKTNKADVAYQTIGIGYFYRFNSTLRFLIHYDHILNERSTALSGYNVNRDDDVITLRAQYKF